MEVVFTEYAVFESKRRGVEEELIRSAVLRAQQKLPSKKGRVILQSKYYDQSEDKEMLLRIIDKKINDKFEVITVYKTSRIKKYWIGD